MKRNIVCLVFLIMITFTSSAFATNWVWVQKENNSQANVYFDADTVFKKADTVTFWVLFVYDQSQEFDVKKHMWQYVVNTKQPRTFKTLAAYAYDSKNAELMRGKGMNYGTSLEGTATDNAVTNALKYVKEGNDTGEKPTLP